MSSHLSDPPVLVWQMGKVGSTSIGAALEQAAVPFVQVHHLKPDHLATVLKQYTAAGAALPDHLSASMRMLETIRNTSANIRIVSVVRDPVPRNLSALFETWKEFPPQWQHEEGIEELNHWFLLNFDYSVLRWFNSEIENVIGVNIYDFPFDHGLKRLSIEQDRFKILVLRTEDSDIEKELALRAFLRCDNIHLQRLYTSEDKENSSLFMKLRGNLWISRECADKVYNSSMMRHFYSCFELEAFRGKWTLVPNDPCRGPTKR